MTVFFSLPSLFFVSPLYPFPENRSGVSPPQIQVLKWRLRLPLRSGIGYIGAWVTELD